MEKQPDVFLSAGGSGSPAAPFWLVPLFVYFLAPLECVPL